MVNKIILGGKNNQSNYRFVMYVNMSCRSHINDRNIVCSTVDGIRDSVDPNKYTFIFGKCSNTYEGRNFPNIQIRQVDNATRYIVSVIDRINSSLQLQITRDSNNNIITADVLESEFLRKFNDCPTDIPKNGFVNLEYIFSVSGKISYYYTWDLGSGDIAKMTLTLYDVVGIPIIQAIPPDFPQNNADNNDYPKLYIEYDLTTDNQDIAYINVQIDDYNIYELIECFKNNTFYPSRMFTQSSNTITSSYFTINNPNIHLMINACGNTLREKIDYISGIVGNTFNPENLIAYGIIVYILGALVYGNIDLCYLGQVYYHDLIYHLQNSRFAPFAPLLTDPEYNLVFYKKYFLCKC